MKNYPRVAKTSATVSSNNSVVRLRRLLTKALFLSSIFFSYQSQLFADDFPKPYQAVYSSSFSGISAEMQQSLDLLEQGQWRLRNNVSIAFVGFSEEVLFSASSGVITPQRYQYNNAMSSKRSSDLTFNRELGTVTDSLHPANPLLLQDGALDKLSFQAQLRADLISADGNFTEKNYLLVDRTKYKNYTVRKLADVIIGTPIGTLDAVKLEQRRPGKESYTLIWTAPDLDHIILRIQRMDGDSSGQEVNLKSLTINGKKIVHN